MTTKSETVERAETLPALERPDFETVLETLQLDSSVLELDATMTLTPPPTLAMPPEEQRPYLPRLLRDPEAEYEPQVTLRGTIAEGGMGVVRLAEQLSLGRQVAVKQVRPDRRSDGAAAEILCEGWTVGALQHPNIVPVYMLGEDEAGYPTIVMKRIEGKSWGQLLRDSDEELPADDAPLDFHLDVLMEVCRAVHFAHSRGIIHRDLKPDNVMVGEFGEVYVLDWGIAVSMDEGSSRFRSRSDADELAGTPGYMAPEMVGGDGAQLSERTDVYQLGAILYEIVTGRLRHDGEDIYQVLYSIYESAPVEFDDDVPAELAEIMNTAMAADPAGRYDSVEDLRRALSAYLRHRNASELSDEATDHMAQLEELAESEDVDAVEAHRLYGVARFGFDNALKIWPDCEAAIEGRRRALEAMARVSIALDDLPAARASIGELEELGHSAPELRHAVDELAEHRRERAAEFDRLRDLEQSIDPDAGASQRAWLMGLLAIDWATAPAVMCWVRDTWLDRPLTHLELAIACGSFWVAVSLLIFAFREKFFVNQLNKKMFASLMLGGALFLFNHLVIAPLFGLSMAMALAADALVWCMLTIMLALLADRRLWPASLLYLGASVAVALVPHDALDLFSIFNAVAFAFVWWVWRSPEQSLLRVFSR